MIQVVNFNKYNFLFENNTGNYTYVSRIIQTDLVTRLAHFVFFYCLLHAHYFLLYFRKFNNMIGCVDICHIRVSPHKDEQIAFYNYKRFHSIHLQAVCLYNKKFTDIFVGYIHLHMLQFL